MIFDKDDTVFDVAMRAMIRATRHPSIATAQMPPAENQGGLEAKARAVLAALGIDASVPMRQWIETGDPQAHPVVEFGEAEVGEQGYTYEFKDKTRFFTEWAWVVDTESFDECDRGVVVRKTWQLINVEECDLDQICENCEGAGIIVTGEHDPFCDETLCEKYGCSYEETTCPACFGQGNVRVEYKWVPLNVGPWEVTNDDPDE